MDLNSTIDIVLKDLEEARKLIDDLKNKPDLPELQIELAKAKCKSAEDVIRLLQTSISKVINPVIADPPEVVAAPPISNPISNEEPEPEVVADLPISNEKAEPERVTHPSDVVADLPISNEKKEIPVIKEIIQETQTSKQEPEKRIVADRFSHLSHRMNDKLIEGKSKDGKEITRKVPVSDLKKAISINDRFIFIRELFGGKEERFRTTLNELNEAVSMDNASEILKNAIDDLSDTETARQLLELVERKITNR